MEEMCGGFKLTYSQRMIGFGKNLTSNLSKSQFISLNLSCGSRLHAGICLVGGFVLQIMVCIFLDQRGLPYTASYS
jgi:hypothetical protein